MQPRNPSRRNRNIGTAKQGHGADNEFDIPESWHQPRAFFERLPGARLHAFSIHGTKRVALVEPPAEGNFYGCTVDDLARLLAQLPEQDLEGLDLFLFRQPTRKQKIMRSVWGRFIYYTSSVKHHGPAICFEAQQLEPLEWSTSITPEDRRELDRLRADGHDISVGKRAITITMSPSSFRATTLYRTALHEIGHYVDWWRSALRVQGSDQEKEDAERAFSSKSPAMKEDFAHRYAEERSSSLKAQSEIPFPVCWNAEEMEKVGIERNWFIETHP